MDVSGLIVWICKRFDKERIEKIILGLVEALKNHQAQPMPRDKFKEEHPHYREFHVDPAAPLKERPVTRKPAPKKKRRSTSR